MSAAARKAPGRADRTAVAAGTDPVADRTVPAEEDTVAEVAVQLPVARTAAAAERTARAAAARTDSVDSARKTAAARNWSCRQDIGPRHLGPDGCSVHRTP